MKIVQGDGVPVVEGLSPIRAGVLSRQILLTGEEGSPGNFIFGLYYQVGDFFSPRHTHPFDQWRYQLEGECGFDKNGTMTAGTLGYFPEGAYYGPQTSDKPNVTVVAQFGGPSGAGFLSNQQVRAAAEEMKAFGRFEGGVFYRNEGVEGKKALDSFQATWEYINKRPMTVVKPQYADPLLMDTANYRWLPLDGAPGVQAKSYGTFTDCAIRSASYKLAPGATLRASGRGIFLALSGAGTVAGEPLRRLTAVYLESGEEASFAATESAEILLLGLPEIARMKTPLPEHDAALAPAGR
jgi:hypothetical protein